MCACAACSDGRPACLQVRAVSLSELALRVTVWRSLRDL